MKQPILIDGTTWCLWDDVLDLPFNMGASWKEIIGVMIEAGMKPSAARDALLEASDEPGRWHAALFGLEHTVQRSMKRMAKRNASTGDPIRGLREIYEDHAPKSFFTRAYPAHSVNPNSDVQHAVMFDPKEEVSAKRPQDNHANESNREARVEKMKASKNVEEEKDRHTLQPLTRLAKIAGAPHISSIYKRMRSNEARWAHYERVPAPEGSTTELWGKIRDECDWDALEISAPKGRYQEHLLRARRAEALNKTLQSEIETLRSSCDGQEVAKLTNELSEARAMVARLELLLEEAASTPPPKVEQNLKCNAGSLEPLMSLLESLAANGDIEDQATAYKTLFHYERGKNGTISH